MRDEPLRIHCETLALALIVACWLSPVEAARWNQSSSVGIGVSLTDITPERPGEPGVISSTARINPSLSLQRRAGTSDVFVSSELEILKSLDDNDHAVYPELFGSLRTELVDSLLSLDSSIHVKTVEIAEDDRVVGASNFSGDVSTTVSLRVNPTLDLALGSDWYLRGNYAFNLYQADRQALSNSRGNQAAVRVERDSWAQGYTIGVEASRERTTIADSSPLVEQKFSVFGGIGIIENMRFIASAGREANRLPQSTADTDPTEGTGDENSDIWDIGLIWRPSPRLSVEAGYGERFFGRRPQLEIEYRNSRSNLALSWSRELVRTRQQLPEAELISAPDEPIDTPTFAESGIDPFNEIIELESTSLTVDEQFQIRYILRGRVSRLRLETNYSRRETNLDGAIAQSSDIGFLVGLERRLSEVTLLRVSYDHQQGLGGSRYHEATVFGSVVFNLR